MEKTEKVVLEYVGQRSEKSTKAKPDWFITTPLPNKGASRLEFHAGNNWQVTIDRVLKYRDDFKNVRVLIEDYANFLLTNYGPKSKHKILKLVKKFTVDAVQVDPLDELSEAEKPEEEKPTPKGKKKHEEEVHQ